MAMTTNEIELIFKANADEFRKDIAGIKDELAGIKGSTTTVSNALGGGGLGKAMFVAQIAAKAVTQAIKAVGRAVGSMAKNVLVGGSQLSRMKISTDVLARNMGIASEEIDGLRSSLSEANTYGLKAEQVISSLARTGLIELANGTDEATKGLSNMYPEIWNAEKGLQALDGRTGEMAYGVNALVLEMKDLGAVAGTSSSEAIEQLTDFINRGTTANVSNMIAIGNLGKEYEDYRTAIGKTNERLTAGEEAQARLNIVMREGKNAVGAYAESYTTAGKMMSSIKDATTSIFEELGSYLEPLFASISSAVLSFVQNIRNWLISNAQTFKDWAIKVSAWVIYVVRGIGRMLSRIPSLGKFMGGLANFSFPKVEVSANNTSKSLSGVSGAMKEATGQAKDLNKALVGLAGFDEMNVLKQDSSSSGSGSTGFDTSGLSLDPDVLGGLGGVSEMFDEINGKVEDLENTFGGFEIQLGKVFNPFLDIWNNNTSPALEGLLDQLGMGTDTGIQFADVLGFIGAVGATSFELITYLIGGVIAIVQLTIWNIKSLIGTVVFAGQVIGEIFRSIVSQLKTEWALTMTFLKNTLKIGLGMIWSLLTGDMKGFLEGWGNLWKNFGSYIEAIMKSRFNNFVSLMANIGLRIVEFFMNILGSLPGWVKGMLNGVINWVNRWIIRLAKIKIPDWVPDYGGRTFGLATIPPLAQGGVIKKDTMALLHKSSDEAVLPLNGNNEWIERLASKINGQGSNGNGTIIVQIGDEKIAERVIDYANDKSLRTGVNLLNI